MGLLDEVCPLDQRLPVEFDRHLKEHIQIRCLLNSNILHLMLLPSNNILRLTNILMPMTACHKGSLSNGVKALATSMTPIMMARTKALSIIDRNLMAMIFPTLMPLR